MPSPNPTRRSPSVIAPDSVAGAAVSPPWSRADRLQKPMFLLFLVLFAVNEGLLLLRVEPTGGWRWVEWLFLASAAASALVSLAQRLPMQNVGTTGMMILGISGLLLGVSVATGIPFGPRVFGEAMGPRMFDAVPWTLMVIWLVVIVNGRGVARLIMRPWRKTNYYGFWVMGLTGLMAVHFDLGLEPFATSVKPYWLWQPMRTSFLWYSAPWVNFLGWFVGVFTILCMTLPWMINKLPVKRPMDYHPLIQWCLLNTWLLTGNAMEGNAAAAAVTAVGCLVIAVFAVRGARW